MIEFNAGGLLKTQLGLNMPPTVEKGKSLGSSLRITKGITALVDHLQDSNTKPLSRLAVIKIREGQTIQ